MNCLFVRARSKTKCNTPTVYGVAIGKQYEQLKPEERATVMLMDREGSSVRAMSRALNRPPSTISREMELAGVVERKEYCENPVRYEYELTGKGRDLLAILKTSIPQTEGWVYPKERGRRIRFGAHIRII